MLVDGGVLVRPVRPMVEVLWQLEGAGGYEQDDMMAWPQVREHVSGWMEALRQRDVKEGDRVVLFAETSREWVLANHAIHACGAVAVPIYPTLLPDQVEYIVKDCDPRLVIADEALAQRVPEAFETMLLEGQGMGTATPVDVSLDQHAVIIYTSGTTGTPKGVVLSHRNLSGDVEGAVQGVALDQIEDPSLVAVLPLAHVAGYVSLHALMAVGGHVLFSRPDRMTIDLGRFRPTIMLAVPRLWERIVRKIEETVSEGSAVKKALFGGAKRTAVAAGKVLETQQPSGMLALRWRLFERLVYQKLRRKLGMDRTIVAVTGAAAVRPDLLWLLRGMGLPIIEGYGMTESSALSCATRVDDWRAGTVGTPLPGSRIRIDEGEVLIGGIGVFQEYLGLPEETAATRVMMDGEPWIRSGDLGEWRDGRLAIVDRKKELEVLDTGKMIAPVRVEELLKAESLLVEDACLIGTDRKFASMLIQPSYDSLLAWAKEHDVPAEGIVRQVAPTGEEQTYSVGERFLQHPKVRALYQQLIDSLNQKVADFERVKAFALVPDAFTVDRDELTPSFKKKRRRILENHAARVEAMYAPS